MDTTGRAWTPYPFSRAEVARLAAYKGAIAAGLYSDELPAIRAPDRRATSASRGAAPASAVQPGRTVKPDRSETSRRRATPTSDQRER